MAEQNGTNTGKCAEEYVVKRGDSFYLIAHKLGVPLRDLLAANRDIHPARLMVGDVLCVPREEDDSPQTGGLGGSGTTQTTQTTGAAPSTGTAQTTQATGTAPSTGMTQTTQVTGMAQATGTTQTTQVTGMVQATGTTQTTQVTGMAQATGTTQTTQVTGTVQATGTTQATGATQATGTTQAVQPTCMTGQIAPDTTLSCTEDEQWTVQKGADRIRPAAARAGEPPHTGDGQPRRGLRKSARGPERVHPQGQRALRAAGNLYAGRHRNAGGRGHALQPARGQPAARQSVPGPAGL